MPAVIRQALSERIRRLPELQSFLRDLSAVAGVNVDFATTLGHREPRRAPGTLCHLLHQTPAGLRTCQGTVNRLLQQAEDASVQSRCCAGLWESVVPLCTGGQTLGYLMYGGYFTNPPNQTEQRRIREVLARSGAEVSESAVSEAAARSPCMESPRRAALARVMKVAAEHLVAAISYQIVAPAPHLPRLARLTCERARQSFTQPLSLTAIARELGVTSGHLCRVFHQATGLRFREYVARLRAEHARDLLLNSDAPVTEIAFASGFQSLSQFNRVFHRVHGTSGLAMRQKARASSRRR